LSTAAMIMERERDGKKKDKGEEERSGVQTGIERRAPASLAPYFVTRSSETLAPFCPRGKTPWV
jgi:hypothetical protein